MVTEFDLGDRILMKKPHACGSSEWTITRTGADIKIKCCGCGPDSDAGQAGIHQEGKKEPHGEQQK